jgi:hypothetical protein
MDAKSQASAFAKILGNNNNNALLLFRRTYKEIEEEIQALD